MPSRVLAPRDIWHVEAGHMRIRVIAYPSPPIPRPSPCGTPMSPPLPRPAACV